MTRRKSFVQPMSAASRGGKALLARPGAAAGDSVGGEFEQLPALELGRMNSPIPRL